MSKYSKNYYRGKGLTFNYDAGIATDFDTGEIQPLRNLFTCAARIKQEYFARWINRDLFPTEH